MKKKKKQYNKERWWPGRTGQLPARNPHRPGRAQLRHPVLPVKDSLNNKSALSSVSVMASFYLFTLRAGVLGIDNRDGKLSQFCLKIATYTIEQYCYRKMMLKNHFEDLDYWGDSTIPLKYYPVREILVLYIKAGNGEWELAKPDFYWIVPEAREDFDMPVSLVLGMGLRIIRGEGKLKVIDITGYTTGQVPLDLASSCMKPTPMRCFA